MFEYELSSGVSWGRPSKLCWARYAKRTYINTRRHNSARNKRNTQRIARMLSCC